MFGRPAAFFCTCRFLYAAFFVMAYLRKAAITSRRGAKKADAPVGREPHAPFKLAILINYIINIAAAATDAFIWQRSRLPLRLQLLQKIGGDADERGASIDKATGTPVDGLQAR
jgi:hypothetical protein